MTRLEIMADYFQIYVCDPAHNEDWSALWTDQTVDNRIVALPHTVVFGTGRNMTVPVDIVVHEQQPDLTALIVPSDHAVVGGIVCGSGQLKVAGCTDYLPGAFTLSTSPGRYGIAFLSFDLSTIDGLEGDDRSPFMSGQLQHCRRRRCSNGGAHYSGTSLETRVARLR
jgi:hypothetical protein